MTRTIACQPVRVFFIVSVIEMGIIPFTPIESEALANADVARLRRRTKAGS
ncbi:hypothetical protein [Agrobacterium sp. CG674]